MKQHGSSSRGVVRGSSGATLKYGRNTVTKKGGASIMQQGLYVMSFDECDTLPRITIVSDASYTMERLQDPSPLHILDAVKLTERYITGLKRDIWCLPARVKFDLDAHEEKIESITPGLEDMRDKLASVRKSIVWESLVERATHGDPTFDNLMHRGGDIVIIDPIPPTPAVPDFISKDIGKIMMSLVGFESIRYGTERISIADSYHGMQYLKRNFGRREFVASQYWCVIHLLRAVPYMPTEEIGSEVTKLARLVLNGIRS